MDIQKTALQKIGDILRGRRAERSLTLLELSQVADVHKDSIAKIERGDGGNLSSLQSLLAALDLEIKILRSE